MEKDNQAFFWIKSEGEKKLATENMIPGNRVYKEKIVTIKGIEYRLWDPFRSKLAAAIMNGLETFPIKNKSSVLYLGTSSGTTVSHISDIVGPSGMIFGVEHTSRVAREFLDRVVAYRKNIIPILQMLEGQENMLVHLAKLMSCMLILHNQTKQKLQLITVKHT